MYLKKKKCTYINAAIHLYLYDLSQLYSWSLGNLMKLVIFHFWHNYSSLDQFVTGPTQAQDSGGPVPVDKPEHKPNG